jgi:hypothetical protein
MCGRITKYDVHPEVRRLAAVSQVPDSSCCVAAASAAETVVLNLRSGQLRVF